MSDKRLKISAVIIAVLMVNMAWMVPLYIGRMEVAEYMSFDEEDWNRPVMGSGARDTVRERRSLIENNNGVVDRVTYPIQYSSETYKGKFFTRGCRGMLERLEIYCERTAAFPQITLRYSPHPCLGPIGEVVITPLVGWSWAGLNIEEMWNYDSLFVWVHVNLNSSWGYDAELPYDGHESDDAGATWADLAIRPFIRAIFTGETPGDVPVSGVLNVIPIPSTSSDVEVEGEEIAVGVITSIAFQEGAGYCDYIVARVEAATNSHLTSIFVECDGNRAYTESLDDLFAYGHTTSTPTVSLPKYGEDEFCYMLIHKRFEFRRRLEVFAHNNFNIQFVTVALHPTLMR